VSIKGFGRFEVRERKERIGRNPRTGLDLTLPAGKRVKFVPGKGLKEAIQ
jgi:DNA-binding protein HU-beta